MLCRVTLIYIAAPCQSPSLPASTPRARVFRSQPNAAGLTAATAQLGLYARFGGGGRFGELESMRRQAEGAEREAEREAASK